MELCCVLLYFEAVTGLRVNLEKEELVAKRRGWEIWPKLLVLRLVLTYELLGMQLLRGQGEN